MVSTYIICKTLKEAGFDWQKDRSWCETGVVERKRRGEVVEVIDPDATTKKLIERAHTQGPGQRSPGPRRAPSMYGSFS